MMVSVATIVIVVAVSTVVISAVVVSAAKAEGYAERVVNRRGTYYLRAIDGSIGRSYRHTAITIGIAIARWARDLSRCRQGNTEDRQH
jgi:hypothetical protein